MLCQEKNFRPFSKNSLTKWVNQRIISIKKSKENPKMTILSSLVLITALPGMFGVLILHCPKSLGYYLAYSVWGVGLCSSAALITATLLGY
jgi:hypothetical protein